ncbi:DUF1015 domain-containing protein [Streptomyces sp. 549]|uniref:DUF1015 domain-containing protein n=1 Tax=Streptomyces sp. 549 TaxID=3049076 RepID=UPI0024C28E91|nr:DUF1015 domain-containing protein [Streptomyces sp. 549]MDK1475624.1 DUF1015 domain-containing protein [Streptomyces sp. 549]
MCADGLSLAPFRGLRYAPERVGSLASVTSPPYDVVVRPDGVHHLETADQFNIVRLILPHSADPEARHRKAAETLRDWESRGVLVRDREPALYVYEQRRGEVVQRGLIGALRLSPPQEGVVLPHEDVMPDVVADRMALMRETAANLEPLLLSYRGDGLPTGAGAVVERTAAGPPLLATTTEDGFAHRLWSVTDPAALREVDDDLAARSALIADGHHRWATYLRLREEHPDSAEWAHGLVLLVDTARYPLRVQAIHRVLPRLAAAEALDRLDGALRVRPVAGSLDDALAELAASPGTAFVLAGADGSFHLLDRPDPALVARTVGTDRPAAWRALDATVLHSALLGPVWQVPDDPASVRYLHSAASAVEQARRTGGSAVLMRAVAEETVRELARQGVMMPRKSTSFGPKPASGLVLRTLDPPR